RFPSSRARACRCDSTRRSSSTSARRDGARPPRKAKRIFMAGTVIGEGLNIEGDVSSEEEVVVQGNLRGKLTTTDAVSVGSSAVIEADVSAQSLTIAGQVTGDV